MSTQDEKAREALTQQRQHEEHLQESMRGRAEAEVSQTDGTNTQIEEKAREAEAKQRQKEAQLKESMRERSEEEIR